MKFYDFELNDNILDALETMRFEDCTPIQEKAIPPLLEGRDLIGVAQTGTGKTAAFLLPVINRLTEGNYPEDRINCLIMAPTRELAKQIDEQLEGFSYFVPVSSLAVYGGNDGPQFAQQKQGLKSGADIIIATPGRLISHLSLGYVDLSHVSFFILDEADRMLDMGFFDDIMQIASHLPKERQTIMFSATMPDKIKKLAKNILRDPAYIQIAVSKPAENIVQQCVLCYEPEKVRVVKKIFSDSTMAERALIFASSKQKVKDLCHTLRQMKYEVAEMHSDLDQSKRDEVMHNYKTGKIKLLVATDIVARGIDIDDIKLVMNYDVPREGEEYVHRIGRTARAGNEGRAITLVNDKDRVRWNRIEKFLGKKIERLTFEDDETKSIIGSENPADTNTPRKENCRKRPTHKPRRRNTNRNEPKSGNDTQGNTKRPDEVKSAPAARTEADKDNAQTRQKSASKPRRQRRRYNKKKDDNETIQ